MKVEVVNRYWDEVTRVATADEWDRDDTFRNHEIAGISIPRKSSQYGYYDLEVSFDINQDTDYYLVCAFYDTGDSFGRDENRVEYVDLFSSLEKAESLVKLINKEYNEYKKTGNTTYNLTYEVEEGNTRRYSCPWYGYFESLRDVEVVPVRLIKKSKI